MRIKTAYLTGPALDWAVGDIEFKRLIAEGEHVKQWVLDAHNSGKHDPYSTNWLFGGPVIDRENITIIRADDDYETDADGFTTNKRIPQWFAECSRWTGHGLTTCYEGENMDPTFMISEDSGYYGTTPLIAAMRSFVASKLGDEVEIPEELMT